MMMICFRPACPSLAWPACLSRSLLSLAFVPFQPARGTRQSESERTRGRASSLSHASMLKQTERMRRSSNFLSCKQAGKARCKSD